MTISVASFTKLDFRLVKIENHPDGYTADRHDHLYAVQSDTDKSKGYIRISIVTPHDGPEADMPHALVMLSDGNGSITVDDVTHPIAMLHTDNMEEIIQVVIDKYNKVFTDGAIAALEKVFARGQ